VRWVDLGTLTPSDDVAFACLTAPGMRVEPERKALTTLAARLADRETPDLPRHLRARARWRRRPCWPAATRRAT